MYVSIYTDRRWFQTRQAVLHYIYAYAYIFTYTYVLFYIHRPSLISRFQTRQAVRIGAGPYHSAATVACGQGLGWCNSLQLTTTRCNSLQHTAIHCNALQHTAAYHFAAAVAAGRASDAATHYNALQLTVTHCNTLQHMTFFCCCLRAVPRMVQHTAKLWNTNCNKYPATHCNSMQHNTTHCNILQLSLCCYCRLRAGPWIVQHTATYCNTHSATYCNTHGNTHCNPHMLLLSTLQHTATHCNTLQHTATHNTLQHTSFATVACGQGLGWRNTLQRTATHNNTLQLTATLCNAVHYTATHGSILIFCFFCCRQSLYIYICIYIYARDSCYCMQGYKGYNCSTHAYTRVFVHVYA